MKTVVGRVIIVSSFQIVVAASYAIVDSVRVNGILWSSLHVSRNELGQLDNRKPVKVIASGKETRENNLTIQTVLHFRNLLLGLVVFGAERVRFVAERTNGLTSRIQFRHDNVIVHLVLIDLIPESLRLCLERLVLLFEFGAIIGKGTSLHVPKGIDDMTIPRTASVAVAALDGSLTPDAIQYSSRLEFVNGTIILRPTRRTVGSSRLSVLSQTCLTKHVLTGRQDGVERNIQANGAHQM